MEQRHKHADAIIAWAEGAEIEARSSADRKWVVTRNPTWWEDVEYRVKPVKKYRVALFRKQDEAPLVVASNSQVTADNFESMPGFIRWLTDWVDYEE